MNYSKDSAMPLVVDHIRENDPGCKDSPTKIMKDLGKKGIHIKRSVGAQRGTGSGWGRY